MKYALFACALLLIGAGCARQSSEVPETGIIRVPATPAESGVQVGIAVGDQAPIFLLADFEGSQVQLSNLRGTPVLIDFWAAWCPFCVDEIPAIEEIHQEFGGRIVVLGIHRTDTESREAGARFAESLGVTYSLLQDTDGSVYRTYTGGQRFMPVAFFIDASGIIRERIYGPKTAVEMRAAISRLLE
ncbi:TlpA family protein disulfide reductase [Candidatus Uhrbacteria bacterium]|nr:TlpA family protein disulfide reductase [Candidatus Uhrbacteria bacterium]